MKDTEEFNQSDVQEEVAQSGHNHAKINVSVLKNIPAALQIMQGQTKSYEIYPPIYLFSDDITKTNKYVIPKNDESAKVFVNRLLSIQDATFEHVKMKQQINDIYCKNDKECKNNLWQIYSERELYYSRFEQTIKRQNFANVFMKIANVNLDSKIKGNLPSIKNRGGIVQNSNSLIFDSHFQGANLLYVYQNSEDHNGVDTYDLILHNDINTRGHNQWFYFKVTNTKKNQIVKINIVNLVKKQSLFSYGLKPLCFSQKNVKNGISWVRNGQKICYQQSGIKRQYGNQSYYSLSFQYEFRQPYDTVYFAPSFPYTYSQLISFMDRLVSQKKYSNFLQIKKLCQTVGKNAINIITISSGKRTEKDVKIVWILGRQHPFETTSSYMLQRVITKLLDLMVQQREQGGSFYEQYVFKIVPMVNPDGVIHGNARAQLTGIDPNRVWKRPSKEVSPNVYYIKKQIMKDRKQVSLVLDLHFNSKKLGCFFYGNYDSSDLKSFRMLPSRVCQNDIRFCYKNCRFRGGDENSARRALYEQLKIANIYTVECSLLGYMKENRITEYKIEDYQQMGLKIIDTFFQIERQKGQQIQGQINRYPDEGNDFFCDAQSARSDSSVSEQEYEEVYQWNGSKKHGNVSRKKKKDNGSVEGHQQKVSNHSVKRDKFIIKVVESGKNQKSEGVLQKERQPTNVKVKRESQDNFKRQISVKPNNLKSPIKNLKKIKDYRRAYRSIKEQQSVDRAVGKTFDQKSPQLQQTKHSSKNIQFYTQKITDTRLMFMDPLEDQKISHYDSKVDVQTFNHSKQNLNVEQTKKERSISNMRNLRHPYPLAELGQVSKVERLKKERRGVLMFRN